MRRTRQTAVLELLPTALPASNTQALQRFPIYEGPNVIGRDPTSAVCIDRAGVSGRHALIGRRPLACRQKGRRCG